VDAARGEADRLDQAGSEDGAGHAGLALGLRRGRSACGEAPEFPAAGGAGV